MSELNALLNRALVAEQRLAALEAALPKTADGVAIVPGMRVWDCWNPNHIFPDVIEMVGFDLHGDESPCVEVSQDIGTRPTSEFHRRHPKTGLTPEETEAGR